MRPRTLTAKQRAQFTSSVGVFPCIKCNREHKGKQMVCYPCRNPERSKARYHETREFWQSCLDIAGEYVFRAMRGGGR